MLLSNLPALLVGVQPLVGRMRQRLADPIGVQLRDVGVLVGVAQLVRGVEPVQHAGPRLGQFAVELDGLAATTHASARACR